MKLIQIVVALLMTAGCYDKEERSITDNKIAGLEKRLEEQRNVNKQMLSAGMGLEKLLNEQNVKLENQIAKTREIEKSLDEEKSINKQMLSAGMGLEKLLNEQNVKLENQIAKTQEIEKTLIGKNEEDKFLDTKLNVFSSSFDKEILNIKNLIRESVLDSSKPAFLDSTMKGYSIAKNNYGSFPMAIDDAQPYLDGYKIKLRIGNLTSSTMNNVELDIQFGSTRKKTIAKIAKLYPGMWNVEEIVISPSSPEDMKLINVYVNAEGMSLTYTGSK